MYVCICNALKDRDLKSAASDPEVKSSACVFKRCEAKPKCGRCLPDVADMISAARDAALGAQPFAGPAE